MMQKNATMWNRRYEHMTFKAVKQVKLFELDLQSFD